MVTSKVPSDRSYENIDQISPWHIMDGKWGGWGPSYWHHAKEWGFAKGDVVEWHFVEGESKWYRVWIDSEKQWRALTEKEIARLPVLAKPRKVSFDAPLSWPLYPFRGTAEQAEVVAAVLAQPVLQIIQQAPVIKSAFSLDTPSQAG